MTLFSRILSQRTDYSAPEQRVVTGNASIPPPSSWIMDDHVVAPIGEHQALRNMTVYGCVRLLADTIASLPMKVYRDDAGGFPKAMPSQPVLVDRPCPDLTQYDFKWMMVESLALRGNSYHYITGRDNNLWPTGLLPLHPDMVQVEVPPGEQWTNPVYRVGGTVVPSVDILHIKRFVQPGWPVGLSPIRQAAGAIGMALSAEEYGYRYFKDAAHPSGALMTEQTLPPEEITKTQKEWIATHGGRRLPAVLTGGFKWAPISISPEESQFLQTRQFQDNQIMRLFGIPPHMLGDHQKATSWGTGIEQLSIGFLVFTLNSWLMCMEEAFTRITPRGQYMKFDTDVMMRGDTVSRWESHKIAREIGARNADEIRAAEGQAPIPGGDGQMYWQPVNMTKLGYDIAEQQDKNRQSQADAAAKAAQNPPPQGDNQQPGQPDEGGQEGTGNAQPNQ